MQKGLLWGHCGVIVWPPSATHPHVLGGLRCVLLLATQRLRGTREGSAIQHQAHVPAQPCSRFVDVSVDERLSLGGVGIGQLAPLRHWAPVIASFVQRTVNGLVLANQLQLLNNVIGSAEALTAPTLDKSDNCLLLCRG